MEISIIIEGAEVSSEPFMPTPLKKKEELDAEKATRILSKFKYFPKDYWPLGRHFTFNANCFKCKKYPNKRVVKITM